MKKSTRTETLKLVSQASGAIQEPGGRPAIARVMDLPEPGRLLLSCGDDAARPARMTSDLAKLDGSALLGREVLVLFENNDPALPIAVALLHAPGSFAEVLLDRQADKAPLEARVDGKTVVIEAEQRLELRCGKASIVIDDKGKITIRGAHLYNRATGPIRIKGGHVEIN